MARLLGIDSRGVASPRASLHGPARRGATMKIPFQATAAGWARYQREIERLAYLIFTKDHPGLASPRRTWRLLTTAREAYRDEAARRVCHAATRLDRKSTRLNSSHVATSS